MHVCIAEVIKVLNADVLALREVEQHKVDDQDVLEYFAAGSGCEAIAGTAMQREARVDGNVLFANFT